LLRAQLVQFQQKECAFAPKPEDMKAASTQSEKAADPPVVNIALGSLSAGKIR
jgi:hypothetical protein